MSGLGTLKGVLKMSGLSTLKGVLGENSGLASHFTKNSGLGTITNDRGIGSPKECSVNQKVQDNGGLARRVTKKKRSGNGLPM
jgi:hypothetical protein